jgi:tetratricopeptide (TPR) repeat protein
MIVVAVAVVAACIPVTRLQLRHWRNSEALFRHTLDATPPNVIPHLKLGEALIEKGEFDQGIKEFNEALRIETLIDREMIDQGAGRTDEMVQINSNLAYIRCKLAQALVAQGKNAEAEAEYSAALQLKPYDVDIREALVLVIQKAATDRASAHLSEALKMQSPPDTGPSAAVVSARRGKIREAIAEYLTVLQGNPNLPIALNNLAWILATSEDPEIRNGAEAIQYAGRACELTHYQTTIYVGTLAAACAEAGRFDDAISMAEKACTLASAAGAQDLLKRNQDLLALYLKHQPYHEMTKP